VTSRRRELSIALQSDKRPGDYASLASLVETAGFDVLSVYGDLLFQPPIVPLTIAAQATSRLRLGPASLNPYTLHPVEIAGQIAMLDLVSEGRAYLGLSRGAWLDELGVTQERPVAYMREALAVVRQLLAGERAAFNGQFFRLGAHHRLRYERARPTVPVLVGSWGRRLLGVGGEVADEVKVGGSANLDLVPMVAEWAAAGASRAKRAPDEVGLVFGAVTVVDDDRRAARALIRRELALYFPVVAGLDPTLAIEPELLDRMARLVNLGDVTAAGNLIGDDLVDRFAFAGTPDDIIHQCDALFAAGVTRIEFGTPHGLTPHTGLRLLGERVVPALHHWRAE
jgi:5,10-methylenetetrahydromethanopterin reductase